jgi:hypothetical protein
VIGLAPEKRINKTPNPPRSLFEGISKANPSTLTWVPACGPHEAFEIQTFALCLDAAATEERNDEETKDYDEENIYDA